jgi:predicted phosphodiesterase
MIFITGDTHGAFDFNKLIEFSSNNSKLTKKDYVIIAGDFGGLWDPNRIDESLARYSKLPITILFVDGNHENFSLLNEYLVEEWNGGKIHRIRPDIIHLMRGQVYTLNGKTFFTFGGASSTDRFLRKENISWWPEEVPTFEQLDEAIVNLKKYNNEVDYIVTHTIDERALHYPPLISHGRFHTYPENQMLSYFEENVSYNHWYFGHYHLDGDINDRKTVLYQKVIKL